MDEVTHDAPVACSQPMIPSLDGEEAAGVQPAQGPQDQPCLIEATVVKMEEEGEAKLDSQEQMTSDVRETGEMPGRLVQIPFSEHSAPRESDLEGEERPGEQADPAPHSVGAANLTDVEDVQSAVVQQHADDMTADLDAKNTSHTKDDGLATQIIEPTPPHANQLESQVGMPTAILMPKAPVVNAGATTDPAPGAAKGDGQEVVEPGLLDDAPTDIKREQDESEQMSVEQEMPETVPAGEEENSDTPMPTREERERVRQTSMHRLLQAHKPSAYQFSKVIRYNRSLVVEKCLESAIYGELPRKSHVEPWLDDEDTQVQASQSRVMQYALARQKRLHDKIEGLRKRYRALNKDWHRHCARLDRMNEALESQGKGQLHGTNSGTGGSLLSQGLGLGGSQASGVNGGNAGVEESSGSLLAAMGASMTRANRRNTQTGFAGFGDAVRSEAEFLEILASLENADMQDPNMRAARTTATEPDMMINPDSRSPPLGDYDDDNGYVADPIAFYLSDFDPDYWTEEEKTTFERRYALFPKQFGKIAASLPHKTAKQCVHYYYLTKHDGFDYKSLSAARNRDRKRKSRVKPKKGRGSALMADLKGDDGEEEEQQSPVEGGVVVSESLSLINGRRPAGPSRARILTGTLPSGDLAVVAEEDEGGEGDGGGARKRRVDEMEAGEKRPKAGRGGKRSKSDKKGRATGAAAGTPVEGITANFAATDALHGDHDLAAAEALGALAGGVGAMSDGMSTLIDADLIAATTGKRKKTSKLVTGLTPPVNDAGEEGAKRSRQTTSSYWSVAERNEFLRSLATWGKDWDAISATLSTKSAAQARNYFSRNADEGEFVEAFTIASDNAGLPLQERQDLAAALIQRRAAMTTDKGQQPGVMPTSGYFANASTSDEGEAPVRGLNINSLLNEDAPAGDGTARRGSLNDWFGKEAKEDSNDDTEEDEQEREPGDYFGEVNPYHARYESGSGYPSSAAPPPSRYPVGQIHRRSPSILSSMPPPSAFIHTSRYQLPGQRAPPSGGGGEDRRSPMPGFHTNVLSRPTSSASEGIPFGQSYGQDRMAYGARESDIRPGWTASAPSPQQQQQQQRHASWPTVYSPAHLAPPASSSSSSLSPSSLSPYPPRPSTSGGPSHSPYHLPTDRPRSSGHMSTTSIRSLSPHPPPQLPPPNTSLFQRRDRMDSPP